MTHHLLVPLDDSERALSAFEHALDVHGDAAFTVLHVVDDLETGYAGASVDVDATEPGVFADARRLAGTRDVDLETVVEEGTPAETILAFAESSAVDGIVMGSQGRSGVSRVLLGSVAEAVTRRSPVPVTVVPSRSDPNAEGQRHR